MNVLGVFKGSYIGAAEFDGKTPTLTIDHVQVVELEDEKGEKKSRPVVYFREVKRGWVLCKTTALCLAQMFTAETDKWTGKQVTLYSADVQVGKERKPGIRVAGSPDLEKAITFELKLPKKKAQRVTLQKTAKGQPLELHDPEPAPDADAEGQEAGRG